MQALPSLCGRDAKPWQGGLIDRFIIHNHFPAVLGRVWRPSENGGRRGVAGSYTDARAV